MSGYRVGERRKDRGSLNHSILTADQVKEIKTSFHLSTAELARRFKVSETTIYQIRTGKTWKHIFI